MPVVTIETVAGAVEQNKPPTGRFFNTQSQQNASPFIVAHPTPYSKLFLDTLKANAGWLCLSFICIFLIALASMIYSMATA